MVLDYLALENRIIKLEGDLQNLSIWIDAYEEDMDMSLTEIDKRLDKIEKGDTYGNR